MATPVLRRSLALPVRISSPARARTPSASEEAMPISTEVLVAPAAAGCGRYFLGRL